MIQGPPGVGKTTLIKSLVKHYTRHNLSQVRGPINIVSGKNRRLTIIECGNDLHSMMDVGKSADLILLLIDGSFGFEMETFEFLNILQAHGFPKILGVLTHLDSFKDGKALKKTKKRMKSVLPSVHSFLCPPPPTLPTSFPYVLPSRTRGVVETYAERCMLEQNSLRIYIY